MSITLFCILASFIQLYSVTTHPHWTFIQNMAEKYSESKVSLKGNDKTISIQENKKEILKNKLNKKTSIK